MTRWLVTGAGGMLAGDVLAELTRRGETRVTAADRAALDVTDASAVTDAVADHDVVVNCAAWTAVDAAETHEAEAFAVNAAGAANLARAASATGAWLAQISTDYVFPGTAGDCAPYAEDAPVGPRSAYGRTKAAGEQAVRAALPDRHWIVRTAWLYGTRGPSFVRTMSRLESARQTVEVVDDQHGQPTWSRDVAARIVDLSGLGVPAGTYHATSSGRATWYDLARAVFALRGADPDRVRRIGSGSLARPAPRPAWSVLGHGAWEAVGLDPLPEWLSALRLAATVGDVLGL